MKIEHWKLIKTISTIYILAVAVLFVCGLAILGLVEYGGKPIDFIGCYGTDVMLFGFECSGFVGAEIVGIALNYPLYHIYMPIFVLFRPILIFVVLGMWFFPAMFFISVKKISEAST